jgi:hypothetical protein
VARSRTHNLLREVFKRNSVTSWNALVDGPSEVFPIFTERESNDRADNYATDTPNGDTFKKHTITKKCHR